MWVFAATLGLTLNVLLQVLHFAFIFLFLSRFSGRLKFMWQFPQRSRASAATNIGSRCLLNFFPFGVAPSELYPVRGLCGITLLA